MPMLLQKVFADWLNGNAAVEKTLAALAKLRDGNGKEDRARASEQHRGIRADAGSLRWLCLFLRSDCLLDLLLYH